MTHGLAREGKRRESREFNSPAQMITVCLSETVQSLRSRVTVVCKASHLEQHIDLPDRHTCQSGSSLCNLSASFFLSPSSCMAKAEDETER